MVIKTRFDPGDRVADGKTVDSIVIAYHSYFDRVPDIHYILSDGAYVAENELAPFSEN